MAAPLDDLVECPSCKDDPADEPGAPFPCFICKGTRQIRRYEAEQFEADDQLDAEAQLAETVGGQIRARVTAMLKRRPPGTVAQVEQNPDDPTSLIVTFAKPHRGD